MPFLSSISWVVYSSIVFWPFPQYNEMVFCIVVGSRHPCASAYKKHRCIGHAKTIRVRTSIEIILTPHVERPGRSERAYAYRVNVWKHMICVQNFGAGTGCAIKSNGGLRPRYRLQCFAPSFKFGKSALVFSDFFKTS